MEPKSPQYQNQNQRHYQKIKLKVSISDKYTCKISQQNIKKPNLTHIKKIIHYDQFGFIPGDKDGSTHTNQCEISDQQRKYKSHENMKRCRKSIWCNSTYIYNKISQIGYRGNIFLHNKIIYDKPTTNIILNSEKLKDFPLKIWNKTRMPILTTSVPHSIGSASHSNQTRKRNKRYSN